MSIDAACDLADVPARDCRALSLNLQRKTLSECTRGSVGVLCFERAVIAQRFSDRTVAENGEQSLGERRRQPWNMKQMIMASNHD
jgi:hypothetical protein